MTPLKNKYADIKKPIEIEKEFPDTGITTRFMGYAYALGVLAGCKPDRNSPCMVDRESFKDLLVYRKAVETEDWSEFRELIKDR